MKGSELKLKRKQRGWTQAQLAQRIGVSTGTVINYEKGNKIPESKNNILTNVFFDDVLTAYTLDEKLNLLNPEFRSNAKNSNNPSQYILQNVLSKFHPVEIVDFIDRNRAIYFELEEFRLLSKNAIGANELEKLKHEIKKINERLDNL